MFTVIASKKSLKLAVERNQFKRWVYEAIRERMLDFQAAWSGKFVFSLKKGVTKPSFQQIQEDINTLLGQKNT